MIKRYAIAHIPSRGMYLSTFNDHFVYYTVCNRFFFKLTAAVCLWLWIRRQAAITLDGSYLDKNRYRIVDLLNECKKYPSQGL